MTKTIKKTLFFILLTFSIIPFINVSNKSHAADVNKVNDNIIKNIDKNINFNEKEQKIKYSKDKIISAISSNDLDRINDLYVSVGMPKITLQEITSKIENSIKNTNKMLESKKIKIKNNELVNNTDKLTIQGGWTYSNYYWWGVRHFKSTWSATNWSYQLNDLAAWNAGAAALAGLILGPWSAAPNGLSSAYAWKLSNSVSWQNWQCGNRGVVFDINTWLTYSSWCQ